MNGQQVFIASSSEQRRGLAKKIADELSKLGFSVLPWWDKRAFRAGEYTLPRLMQLANLCEAAVFVFAGDDKVWFRPGPTLKRSRKPILAVRDNVLLEYGIFLNSVGQKNSVIVVEEGVKLPSDMDGMNVIFYSKSDMQIETAGKVVKYFSDLLKDVLDRSRFSETSLAIQTDWTMKLHEIRSIKEEVDNWLPSNLYMGIDGAIAWANVESDPDYSKRTQTNLNGKQIANLIGKSPVCTVVSLGPGLGTVDAELIAHLSQKNFREFVPVDVNRHLIIYSAKNVTQKNPWVECKQGILCDFDQTPAFVKEVVSKHCPGPRLFLMTGGTFGNTTRTEEAQLSSLYQIMSEGDMFVFDLFCYGTNYKVGKDPMYNRSKWQPVVSEFFANGIKKMLGNGMTTRKALSLIDVHSAVGLNGLSRTTCISIVCRANGRTLVDIRRFNVDEIYKAIRKAGFSFRKKHRATAGPFLERHVLMAKK
ncbi:MAG: L-histidine N(alpha)-methyltransferase [Candidatus Thiodiazotropha sp.]